jgi:hypothetical protein
MIIDVAAELAGVGYVAAEGAATMPDLTDQRPARASRP